MGRRRYSVIFISLFFVVVASPGGAAAAQQTKHLIVNGQFLSVNAGNQCQKRFDSDAERRIVLLDPSKKELAETSLDEGIALPRDALTYWCIYSFTFSVDLDASLMGSDHPLLLQTPALTKEMPGFWGLLTNPYYVDSGGIVSISLCDPIRISSFDAVLDFCAPFNRT